MNNKNGTNQKGKNSLQTLKIIRTVDEDNINELWTTTKGLLNKNIKDLSKPRELWISCDAINKKRAKELKRTIERVNGYIVFSLFKFDKMWVVNGMKMILINQLENELTSIQKTAKLHSCELVDWHVEVDTKI